MARTNFLVQVISNDVSLSANIRACIIIFLFINETPPFFLKYIRDALTWQVDGVRINQGIKN